MPEALAARHPIIRAGAHCLSKACDRVAAVDVQAQTPTTVQPTSHTNQFNNTTHPKSRKPRRHLEHDSITFLPVVVIFQRRM